MILSLCACGADKKDEPETESVVSEETDSPGKSDEVEGISDESDSDEKVNENGITETQIQKSYDSIGESVKTEYLEPKGITAEEFEWPGYPQEISAWLYLQFIFQNYISNGEMFDTTGLNESDVPSNDNMKLMNAMLDGVVNWEKSPENSEINMHELPNILQQPQLHEIIPSNVNLVE